MPKGKSKVNSRLGICCMCKESEGKYRCPECDIVTCSLPCIKQHKKDFECSGIRSKTEFVPVKKMNEMHLLSDYRLLEELSRVADACTRDDTKKITRTTPLPYHLQRFRRAVCERQSKLYFLPKNFSKHKDNTTIFNWKTKRINWKLNVTFLHARKYCITVDKCPEDTLLEVVIEKCINTAMERNKSYKSHFKAYQHSRNDIQVLLQAEKVPEAYNKFYVLDNKKTLKDNFIGKRIVEFPLFYVVLKGFYNAQNLKSVCDVDDAKTKVKLESLLISNYSVDDKQMLSEDENEEENNPKKDKDGKEIDISEDDDLDEALDCLDGDAYKNILGNLYKQAGNIS